MVFLCFSLALYLEMLKELWSAYPKCYFSTYQQSVKVAELGVGKVDCFLYMFWFFECHCWHFQTDASLMVCPLYHFLLEWQLNSFPGWIVLKSLKATFTKPYVQCLGSQNLCNHFNGVQLSNSTITTDILLLKQH